MEVIKNKEKYFFNVYNVSNTREVTKLMQRSDLMMDWPSKKVTKTNHKQPDDGLACESLANTWPRIRGAAAVVPSCIISKLILNNAEYCEI